jgi:hypothetical protein
MSILANFYDSMEDYPEVIELLRLRALFALDAEHNSFDDAGAWKLDVPSFWTQPGDDKTNARASMLKRYNEIEKQQSVFVAPETPLGRNMLALRTLLSLTEIECCIFITFAFTDQDLLLNTLCHVGIPSGRWMSFKARCAKLCGIDVALIDACLGPNGSLIKKTMFNVEWIGLSTFQETWHCLTGLAASAFR